MTRVTKFETQVTKNVMCSESAHVSRDAKAGIEESKLASRKMGNCHEWQLAEKEISFRYTDGVNKSSIERKTNGKTV